MRLNQFIREKSYERIVYRVHRNFFTLIPAILIFLLLLAAPFGARWIIITLFPTLLDGAVLYPIMILFGSLYYLSAVLFFYTYFLNFYLDLLVVTNDRLIDIEQIGLFARSVSEVDLFRIQDITSTVKGVFASLFNYGTLEIQTAGAVDKFTVVNIPDPEGLRRAILDLAEKDRQYHQNQT